MRSREELVERLERWGPAAFVLGGIGILGTTVVGSLDVAAVIQSTPRMAMGPLLFGLWFVFVGLVGWYPRIADASPRLSLAGAVTSVIGGSVWTVTMLAAIGVDLTSGRTIGNPGSWGPPLLAGAFILALLSFLAYGIASTRAERPSRTLGLLLLLPVLAFFGQAVLLVSKIVTGDVIAVLQLALGGVVGVVLIAVGYLLRRGAEPEASEESQASPTP